MRSMRDRSRQRRVKRFHRGFTLVELLIVIAIIATLSTIVGSNAATGHQSAASAANRQTVNIVQGAIDRFKAEHGHFPGPALKGYGDGCEAINDSAFYPNDEGEVVLNRLVLFSTDTGEVCPHQLHAGKRYPFGPYLRNRVIRNAANHHSRIRVTPEVDLSWRGNSDTGIGWIYNYRTGEFRPFDG